MTHLIDKPGVYDISDEVYHADPCIEPSLSASIAKVILEQSPRHAWGQHPRLNPKFEREEKTQFDIGTAAHALLLHGEAKVQIIDAPDFKTKAAREARDAARAAGRIPLIAAKWVDVQNMVAAARAQLRHHSEASDAFQNFKPEQTLVWREDEAWCRCKLDALPRGGNVFYDYKSTNGRAEPEYWGSRTLGETGCDVQSGFYRRGIREILGIENPHFRFVVQETSPPYALCVVQLSPEAQEAADRMAEQALYFWRWCCQHDRWPGYAARIAYVDMPPWRARKWLEHEERAASVGAEGRELLEQMLEWQAPLAIEHQSEDAA